ncbi:MAG TPA: hypothetical protein VMW25_04200 [Clostridia bacterium]|nr:hypothetical protein [Clostridia bacterium]
MQKFLPPFSRSQKGQVILVILLIIAVILTVGLSVVSRSVTDIKISQQSQEAARALWVAQGGLEKAIASASELDETEEGVLNIVTQANVGENSEFVFPQKVKANEAATLWLIQPNEDGTISSLPSPYSGPTEVTLAWAESDEQPALEATLIYASAGKYYSRRYAFDPAGRGNFGSASGGVSIDSKDLKHSGTINFADLVGTGTPILIKLRLLYNTNEESIGVRKGQGGNFPLQGHCYVSTATVQESLVSRRLRQCQLWPGTPSIFDFLLYSGGSL